MMYRRAEQGEGRLWMPGDGWQCSRHIPSSSPCWYSPLPPPTFTDTNHCTRELGRLFTLSVRDHLPTRSLTPSIYLSPLAGSQFSHEAFKCQVTIQLTAFPMTPPERSKSMRGKPPPVIYGVRWLSPGDIYEWLHAHPVLFVHVLMWR